MDDIEAYIEKLRREKLISLFQENSVRVGKIQIKHTKTNKKHTLDNWSAQFDSYDRMMRSIPKDLVRVEKDIRLKFVSPFTEEKKKKLMHFIETEVDVLWKKIRNVVGSEFEKLKAGDEFEKRLAATQEKYKELLETHIKKCEEACGISEDGNQKLTAPEVARSFRMGETFLHSVNLLGPLRTLLKVRGNADENSSLYKVMQDVKEGISLLAISVQDEKIDGAMDTVKSRKEIKLQVAKETLLFRDIVSNLEPLLKQAALEPELRNLDIIEKNWELLEGYFVKGKAEWETILPRFKGLYDWFLSEAKHQG